MIMGHQSLVTTYTELLLWPSCFHPCPHSAIVSTLVCVTLEVRSNHAPTSSELSLRETSESLLQQLHELCPWYCFVCPSTLSSPPTPWFFLAGLLTAPMHSQLRHITLHLLLHTPFPLSFNCPWCGLPWPPYLELQSCPTLASPGFTHSHSACHCRFLIHSIYSDTFYFGKRKPCMGRDLCCFFFL